MPSAARAYPQVSICAGYLTHLHVEYYVDRRCSVWESCAFNWAPYFGRERVTIGYTVDADESLGGGTRVQAYAVAVHTEIQMRDLQRPWALDSITNIRGELFKKAVGSQRRQFTWIRLDEGPDQFIQAVHSEFEELKSAPRRPEFSPTDIARARDLEFDDVAVHDNLNRKSPPLPAGRAHHGLVLVIASPVANEPFTPAELHFIDEIHRSIGYAKGSTTLVKVAPARIGDGSPNVVFTYTP